VLLLGLQAGNKKRMWSNGCSWLRWSKLPVSRRMTRLCLELLESEDVDVLFRKDTSFSGLVNLLLLLLLLLLVQEARFTIGSKLVGRLVMRELGFVEETFFESGSFHLADLGRVYNPECLLGWGLHHQVHHLFC
jgi:hypothetical protein